MNYSRKVTMLLRMEPPTASPTPQIYQLRLREQLDEEVAAWFCPLTLTHEADGATTLTGPVRDQAELHGLLIKIRDLNLTLLSVIHQEPTEARDHGTGTNRLCR
jgi:hypothetical protein